MLTTKNVESRKNIVEGDEPYDLSLFLAPVRVMSKY